MLRSPPHPPAPTFTPGAGLRTTDPIASTPIDARHSAHGRTLEHAVRARFFALLLLGALVGAVPPAEAEGKAEPAAIPAQVRAIHQLTDLGTNVESFCFTMIETARMTLQTPGHPITTQLDAKQQARWLKSVETHCRSEQMSERHLAAFAVDYDAEAARKVTEWYVSDAGKRLLALENAAAETDWDAEVVPFINELTSKPVAVERVKLFERIDAAAGSTEDAALLQTGISEVLTYSAQVLLPEEMRESPADLETQFAALRSHYAGQMRAQQSVIFMYVYRNAADADLAAYADFTESPEARWLHTTHRLAMMQLMAEIREAVVKDLSAG